MSYQRKWMPKAEPHLPPDYDDMVIMAVRAFAVGKANEGQQKLAWDYLMYLTAASEEFQDLSYRPGGAKGRRSSDLAEGRRAVGIFYRKLLHPALTPIEKTPSNVGRSEQVITQRAERLERVRAKRNTT